MTAEPQPAQFRDVTLVRQSSAQRYGIGAILVVIFAVLAVRTFTRSATTSALVAGIIVMLVIAVVIVGWIRLLMHPTRLEISASAVTFTGMKGEQTTLTRQPGDELVIVLTDAWRYRLLSLTINGDGPAISLGMYSKTEVRRACEAKGWQVRGGMARSR
jgi:hypothetical protein